jgi:hypothetical protein
MVVQLAVPLVVLVVVVDETKTLQEQEQPTKVLQVARVLTQHFQRAVVAQVPQEEVHQVVVLAEQV